MKRSLIVLCVFFFQAEDGIRYGRVTGVQTCALPISGTGYGLESDWRHGMYQGPDLAVQGVSYDLSRPEDAARMWGMVDAVGRFEYEGHTGYGLYEYWALGDHPSFR